MSMRGIFCMLLLAGPALAESEPDTYNAWSDHFLSLASSSRQEAAAIERELATSDPLLCRRHYFQWLVAGGGLYAGREAVRNRWERLVTSGEANEEEVSQLNDQLHAQELVIASFERGLRYRRYRLEQAEKHQAERAGLRLRLDEARRQAVGYEEFARVCARLHERLLNLVEADRLLFQKAAASPREDYLKELTPEFVMRRARQILEEIQ
jgi:hypothetical protein